MAKLGAVLAASGCAMLLYQYFIFLKYKHWEAIALHFSDRDLPLAVPLVVGGTALILIGLLRRK